jgi:acyl dehydratase
MTLNAANLNVGDSRTEVVLDNISRTQIVMYAGASGDYNPLHSDEVYVTQVAGYPTVFAHGMLSMGATGKVLTDWVGNGRLKNYGVRFVNQVWPGDTLTTTATIEAVREADGQHFADFSLVTVNQDDKPVVTGTATALIDA